MIGTRIIYLLLDIDLHYQGQSLGILFSLRISIVYWHIYIFLLAYLHLTLAFSEGQVKGHSHFDGKYIAESEG